MASNVKFSRRRLISGAASATALSITSTFIRTVHAAGSLSIGFWDHWVPGANDSLTKLCKEWGEKEKMEVKIDYITSQGSKRQLTAVAEAQAKSGHDILQLTSWDAPNQAKNLMPVDDIVNAAMQKNDNATDAVQYVGKVNGSWIGVPATNGIQVRGRCGRTDLLAKHANLDVVKMYPGVNGKPDKALQDQWTWDVFLSAAEKCQKGGNPFGLGLGQTTDSVDWVGALFSAYDAFDRRGVW